MALREVRSNCLTPGYCFSEISNLGRPGTDSGQNKDFSFCVNTNGCYLNHQSSLTLIRYLLAGKKNTSRSKIKRVQIQSTYFMTSPDFSFDGRLQKLHKSLNHLQTVAQGIQQTTELKRAIEVVLVRYSRSGGDWASKLFQDRQIFLQKE